MLHENPPGDIVILVGSGNLHKVEEISAALSGLVDSRGRPVRMESKRSLPAGAEPEETGATFSENALLKAQGYAALAAQLPAEIRPAWVLADDSGLSVDALGGDPGVRSARYAGETATDEENNRKLLRALKDAPQGARGAEFVCAMSLVRVPERPEPPGGPALTVEGRCRGEILFEEAGSGGFGYDPLFFVPSLQCTFAQISTAQKNRYSHRGRALQRLREELPRVLEGLVKEGGSTPRAERTLRQP